jgi:hypothetical protein
MFIWSPNMLLLCEIPLRACCVWQLSTARTIWPPLIEELKNIFPRLPSSQPCDFSILPLIESEREFVAHFLWVVYPAMVNIQEGKHLFYRGM